MKNLIFLTLMLVLSFVSCTREKQQNILFIPVDDMKTIGSLYVEEQSDLLRHIYPDEKLRKEVAARMTPNLQRLAEDGILFRNAYTPSPACNPSRAALMTGIRPHRSGLVRNNGLLFFREWEYNGERTLAEATTLPELLKNNGWYTAQAGKIFHAGEHSFEKADGHRSWHNWVRFDNYDWEVKPSKWSLPNLEWEIEGGPDATVEQHRDYRMADFIAKVLENGKATNDTTTFEIPDDKPFFLACGIIRPHLPFTTTQDMINLFPVEEMTVTRDLLQFFIDDASDLPSIGLGYSGSSIDDKGDAVLGKDRFVEMLQHGLSIDSVDGDLKAWKDMLMHYFASVATADRAIGRLLDGLDNSKYADNTMVVLWSDHGYHLGEKMHVTKFTLWEDATRVCFIIKDPNNPKSAGKECTRPVSLMDIYPTIVNFAGLKLPDERITGRDLTPLLENPSKEWGIPAHTSYNTAESHMIRGDRFKLIRYKGDDSQIELYDLEKDAEEYYNLANDQKYKAILDSMKIIMEIAINESLFANELLNKTNN